MAAKQQFDPEAPPTQTEMDAAIARGYVLNYHNKSLCRVADGDLKSPWQWTQDCLPDVIFQPPQNKQ